MTAMEAEAVAAGLFPAYVANIQAKRSEDGDAFTRQFQALVKESSKLAGTTEGSSSIALLPENIFKNRSKDAVPFDYNLVKLEPRSGAPGDYINASLIKGPRAGMSYIVTQSPLPETVADFWRMVNQVKASVIVNVTCPRNDDKDSFVKYWHLQDSALQPVGLEVKVHNELSRDYFVLRTLVLKDDQTGSLDWVYQLELSEWPKDIADPACAGLAELLKFICHYQKASAGPLIVHGRRGCGRAGTIIALYQARQALDNEGATAVMDVIGTVASLRQQRMKMVETQEQYRFLNFFLAQMIESEFGPQPSLSPSNATASESAVESKAAEQVQVVEVMDKQKKAAETSKEVQRPKEDDSHEESETEKAEANEIAQSTEAEQTVETAKETVQVQRLNDQSQETDDNGHKTLSCKPEVRVSSPVVAEWDKEIEESSRQDEEELARKEAEIAERRKKEAKLAQEKQALNKRSEPKQENEKINGLTLVEAATEVSEGVSHINAETEAEVEKEVAGEMPAVPAEDAESTAIEKKYVDLHMTKAEQVKSKIVDVGAVSEVLKAKEELESTSNEVDVAPAIASDDQNGVKTEGKQDQSVMEEHEKSSAEREVPAPTSAVFQDKPQAQPSEPALPTNAVADGEQQSDEPASQPTAHIDDKDAAGQVPPLAAQQSSDDCVTPVQSDSSVKMAPEASDEKRDGVDEEKEAVEKTSGHDHQTVLQRTRSKGKSAGKKVKRTSVGVFRNLTMLGESAKKSAATTFHRKKSVSENELANEVSSHTEQESARRLSRPENVNPNKIEGDGKETSHDTSEAANETRAKSSGSHFLSRLRSVSRPKIDMPKLDMHKVELHKPDMHKVEMHKPELHKVEVHKLDMPKLNLHRFSSGQVASIDWTSAYDAREANSETNQQRPAWPTPSDLDAFGPYHRYQVPIGPRPCPWSAA